MDEEGQHQGRAGFLLIQNLKHKSRWSNPAAFFAKLQCEIFNFFVTIFHQRIKTECMNTPFLKIIIILTVFCQPVLAQLSTAVAIEADKEALYTSNIEDRAADVIKGLRLTNEVVAGQVHDLLIAQYRVMRARDVLINAQLKAAGEELNCSNRAGRLAVESKPLHDYFFTSKCKVNHISPAKHSV